MCAASSINEVIILNQLKNLRLICERCNLKKISSDLEMRNLK